jgi:hypothetical protein
MCVCDCVCMCVYFCPAFLSEGRGSHISLQILIFCSGLPGMGEEENMDLGEGDCSSARNGGGGAWICRRGRLLICERNWCCFPVAWY